MDDDKNLVAQLRYAAKWAEPDHDILNPLHAAQAANAIERLTRERDELKARIDRLNAECDAWQRANSVVRERAEKAEEALRGKT